MTTKTKTAAKTAPKGPTMKEILAAIKAAKHFTVYLLVGGEKLFTTHPNLREAGIAAKALLTTHKKRPLVSAIGPKDETTVIIEEVWKQAAAAPAKKPKTEKANKAASPQGKRAAIEQAAREGKLPEPPDFSAKTHERFRPKLEELKKLVAAKDVAGLKAFKINPISSSPKALDKFRNLAVIALEA